MMSKTGQASAPCLLLSSSFPSLWFLLPFSYHALLCTSTAAHLPTWWTGVACKGSFGPGLCLGPGGWGPTRAATQEGSGAGTGCSGVGGEAGPLLSVAVLAWSAHGTAVSVDAIISCSKFSESGNARYPCVVTASKFLPFEITSTKCAASWTFVVINYVKGSVTGAGVFLTRPWHWFSVHFWWWNSVMSFSGHTAYVAICSTQAFCMKIDFRRHNISPQKRCTNKTLHSVNVCLSNWKVTKFPVSCVPRIYTPKKQCWNCKSWVLRNLVICMGGEVRWDLTPE